MQSFRGSMQHTASGRKRKTSAWSKPRKRKTEFKELTNYSIGQATRGQDTTQYNSGALTKYQPAKDVSYKREVSKNFTVAPAYNKGAYQVIPTTDVHLIGR